MLQQTGKFIRPLPVSDGAVSPDSRQPMDDQVQRTLDGIGVYMQEAKTRTYSAPAGTRILYVLITQLSRQFLTKEQQQQVESFIEMHEYCLIHNGEDKES